MNHYTTPYNKSRVYYKLGEIYDQKKDFKKARYNFQKSIDADINEFSYLPYCGLGYILAKEKKYKKALPLLKKSIELNDKYYVSQYAIGYCYYETNNIHLAHKHYMNALNLLENRSGKIVGVWLVFVHRSLAEIYLYSKDEKYLSYSKALEHAKKATENSEYIEPYYWNLLAEAYYKNKQYE